MTATERSLSGLGRTIQKPDSTSEKVAPVAEELGMPSETVRHQVRRIQEKLQVADLPQAVAVAIRRGLIG